MSSPAEIPHADEALKSLVARFKADPSEVFLELSAALLARGHASEALRVAEHGLQIVPTSVEGRVERAASLLALGRPRVAYVELRRALAIDPTHRRGMRLLGKAFRDAGVPHRAAKLLAKRSMNEQEADQPPRPVPKVRMPPPAEDTKPMAKASSPPPSQEDFPSDGIPDLFSSLTKDLGLGAAMPEAPVRRVEVTQIIRRKGLPRPPRSASELAAIEGPIVDTTQPGQLIEAQNMEEPEAVSTAEPAPLFDRATTDQLSIAGFALDDEPLFQDDMPFEVRPVDQGDGPDEPASRAPTIPTGARPGGATHRGKDPEYHEDESPTAVGDTIVDALEEQQKPLEELRTNTPSPLNVREETSPIAPLPVVEKKRKKTGHDAPRLQVIAPKAKSSHIALAVVGAVVILLWAAGLFFGTYDTMKAWLPSDEGAAATVDAAQDGSGGAATARRSVP